MMDLQRQKSAVAALSVASNSLLVAAKLVIGLLIGSVSVVSEAIHSGVDLIASVIALVAVRTSSKPADEEHSFGHGKIENLSGAIEALLIFLAAGWIIYEAVHKLIRPQPMEDVGWGVIVMLVSAVLNTIVSHMLFKVARKTDSVALEADAWHLRTDVWTSAGVMVGLALISWGEWIFPGRHFHWLDPVFAIGVALLIIKAAWDLTVQAGRDLIDTNLPAEEKAWIRRYLHDLKTSSDKPNIFGHHRLRTRKSGNTRFVEFHLFVSPDMSVQESHRITQIVKADIRGQLPGTDVLIHIEPYDPKRDSHRRNQESVG
jgi:cation diffusion facilitator family transporter